MSSKIVLEARRRKAQRNRLALLFVVGFLGLLAYMTLGTPETNTVPKATIRTSDPLLAAEAEKRGIKVEPE